MNDTLTQPAPAPHEGLDPAAQAPGDSLDQARAYVARYTASRRENFTVMSRLMPASVRPAFAAVYAFCRYADDLSDDPDRTPAERTAALDQWGGELEAAFAGRPGHPIFVALAPEIETYRLPAQPFRDLLDAFQQDQRAARYADRTALLDYCRRSANPVGRIVLRLFGVDDPEADRLADTTCTGLQLVNFWQDVRRDALERRRCYLPLDVAARHGLDLDALVDALRQGADPSSFEEPFAQTLDELVGWTATYFRAGRGLWPRFTGRRGYTLRLFTLGGEAILRKVARAGPGVLHTRPALGAASRARSAVQALPGLWSLTE
ncbi:MAG: squalene synthase HpnC [Planctomycetota bacterium]